MIKSKKENCNFLLLSLNYYYHDETSNKKITLHGKQSNNLLEFFFTCCDKRLQKRIYNKKYTFLYDEKKKNHIK